MSITLRVSMILLLASSLWSCVKDEPGILPVVKTLKAESISATEVVVSGEFLSGDGLNVTSAGVCWGEGPESGWFGETTVECDSLTERFSVTISGLTQGKLYHFRAFAKAWTGTVYGNTARLYALQPITGIDDEIEAMMELYKLPAVALAITRHEKLVYLKAWGQSDTDNVQPASFNDLYRIASVSKPITMAGTLSLVQRGYIDLDDTVFGDDGILGLKYGTPPEGSHKDEITVRHLLEHSSGWINNPADPLFHDPDQTLSTLIKNLVQYQNLKYLPGTQGYYLNMGYCILGRIIEEKSKENYARYIRKEILSPSGVTEMSIGGSKLKDRQRQEVVYYQAESDPYAMNIERMDAAAGWIANVESLVRFLCSIDGNPLRPDLLTREVLDQTYFGETRWYHQGTLAGTSALLARINNTYNVAILSNTRMERSPVLVSNVLFYAVENMVLMQEDWFEGDLFQ